MPAAVDCEFATEVEPSAQLPQDRSDPLSPNLPLDNRPTLQGNMTITSYNQFEN
jgi:hypothetical protein